MTETLATDARPGLTFKLAIWIIPILYAAHITEEALGFVPWVNEYFSATFTMQQFIKNNAIVMGITLGELLLFALLPRLWTAWLVYTGASSLMLWNAIFHLGATAYFQVYSPGALSAAVLYVPGWYLITRLGHRDGYLPTVSLVTAIVFAAGLMAMTVYSQLINPAYRL